MGERFNTGDLERELAGSADLGAFLQTYADELHAPSFPEYIRSLCRQRKQVRERVILAAGIDRTYGHQLFSGLRRPSRDKVLQLAFGFGLDPEEAQKLLRAAGKSPLYPRLKRDAVVFYALQHRLSLDDVQELLQGCELTPLGELRRDQGES